MNTLVEENYLKALFHLSRNSSEVNINELSKHLDIKMPTATSMMKKLARKGMVHYESYKPLRLTQQGEKEAALITRKHRLTEMYLVEKMGFGWEEVHAVAEQIEHIQSPKFFDKMDELLDYPKVDPHGSPIPDKDGNMYWNEYKKLSDCLKGDIVTLAAVIDTSPEFLKFLNRRNISLHTTIEVQYIEDFDNSIVIKYNEDADTILSSMVSQRLLVEKN